MKFTELKNDIAQGARSVYLLEGDDAYFRARAEEQIVSAFTVMPELNFTSFDGSQYKGAAFKDVVSAALSFPFMAEKRVIKITEFYPTESDYEKYVKPLFDDFPETSILIVSNALSGKGVELKRKKAVAFVDCNRSDPETVTKWVYLTLKRAGVAADVSACEAVAMYCLCDMARVSAETDKLITYAKDGKLTVADVDALVYKDADYRVYELTNAMTRRNWAQFNEIIRDLLQKGMDETAVVSVLLNYFKNALVVLTSDKPYAQLASLLKMKEWGVKKTAEQAAAIGKERLLFFVGYLYDLVSRVKSGGLTPESALGCAVSAVFFKK